MAEARLGGAVHALFFVVQDLEFALEDLHFADHGVKAVEGGVWGCGFGGFGGGVEGCGERGGRVLDDPLGVFEVAPGELVGHAQEGLVLGEVSMAGGGLKVGQEAYEKQMRLCVELCAGELRHGGQV